MSSKRDEQEFRLHPNQPLRVRDDARAWSNAFKRILHFARITSRRKQAPKNGRQTKAYNQRCAVRVTYSPNKVAGQWAAHGRYISRESAAGQDAEQQRGFGSAGTDVDIPATLGRWQKADDPRLFKLIISPEFGDRLVLEKHTRGLMELIEQDLETKLEWVAIIHRNTEHQHVHITLRGVDEKGVALRLPRELILDAEEAQRREVHLARFTSLDRAIRKTAQPSTDGTPLTVSAGTQSCYVKKRLIVLQEMGLAEQVSSKNWQVAGNFGHILREMQKTADRQKALAAHRALMSDPNLPFQVTDIRKVEHLRGRVLGHGEEESTGRTYMLLEGDDKRVHFIYHNRSLQEHRHAGTLKPNSVVTLNRLGLQLQLITEEDPHVPEQRSRSSKVER